MGIFESIRRAFTGNSTAHTGSVAPSPPTAESLARVLFDEYPGAIPTDILFDRADAAGLDVQAVDRELDELRELAQVTVQSVSVDNLRVEDLRNIDSLRARIVGVGHWVTRAERDRYGGPEYLLIPEPENEHDSNAVAVYGVEGRRVGYLSAARAASTQPLLAQLSADAFRVGGEGVSAYSGRLWVNVPRVPALREHISGHGAL